MWRFEHLSPLVAVDRQALPAEARDRAVVRPAPSDPFNSGEEETVNGDFDEDEDPDFEPDSAAWGEDDMCIVCSRLGLMPDECAICGAALCYACYEMGCGICRGPHR